MCDEHRRPTAAVALVDVDLDGERVRAHLCAEHYAEFRRAVAPWWAAGNPNG